MPAANGAKQIKPSYRRRADSDDEDEDDEDDFRQAMDAVEGVPIYTDGELMVRQVDEPLIVNRKLEQLFSKSTEVIDIVGFPPPAQKYCVWGIGTLMSENNRFFTASAVVSDGHLLSSHRSTKSEERG